MLLKTIGKRVASNIKVAIVGSGPAGFYTAQSVLKNPDTKVDIYEKLPVPFGLVRYGVAPDHSEVKNVINSFTNVANDDRVDFYGNVSLGTNIRLDDLVEAYHVVVLCYGSSQDNLLNIEGEKYATSARNFVGWYNGVPEDKDLKINLDCDTACIVGQGNVALDCARILLRPADLDKTDITSHAQKVLSKSRIRRIFIVGRRGPIQVSFTTKELRELIKLNEKNIRLEPSGIFKENNVSLSALKNLSRQRRRLTEVLLNLSTSGIELSRPSHRVLGQDDVELIFKFLCSPQRIVADETTGIVRRLDVQKTCFNNLEAFMDENARPYLDDEHESIDCGLVIRSIGYKAVTVDKSLPMNLKAGSILNTNGRIHGHKNLYCSGWLATGASGVIAGTLNSSRVTAQSILDDIANQELPNLTRKKLGSELIIEVLKSKSVQIVHFNDWLRIDKLEKQLGSVLGKPREKLVDVEKMLQIASHEEGPGQDDGDIHSRRRGGQGYGMHHQ